MASDASVLQEPMYAPYKLLLGPGPSNMPPEVQNAMQQPVQGHMHPEFMKIMADVRAGIQYVFQTTNKITFAMSAGGHSGLEAAMVNLIEPGEKVLIAENGFWGQRAADIAGRCGAEVEKMLKPAGSSFELSEFEEALSRLAPSLLFVCHGESSGGVCQPLEGVGAACHKVNCLLLVDTVASLGAAPFAMDQLEVDCVYSATQKALNCPPGLAPISFSERAWHKVTNRKNKIQSFYMDAPMVANYWGCDDHTPRYHHTAPITTVYALRAALALINKEGIDACVERHEKNSKLLQEGLEKIGLNMFVKDASHRLASINTVQVPEEVDWKAVLNHLMSKHKIEIAGGMYGHGATEGKMWRIGLMGQNSTEAIVNKVLAALEEALNEQKRA